MIVDATIDGADLEADFTYVGDMTINGSDNNGTVAALHVISGTEDMFLAGNELDSMDSLLYLQNNSTYGVDINNSLVVTGTMGVTGVLTASTEVETPVVDFVVSVSSSTPGTAGAPEEYHFADSETSVPCTNSEMGELRVMNLWVGAEWQQSLCYCGALGSTYYWNCFNP
jgi:hypothetical protein